MQRRAVDAVLIDGPCVLTMWFNQETGLSEFIIIVLRLTVLPLNTMDQISSHKGKRFCWQICIFSVYSAWMTNLHKNKGNTLGGGGTRYNGPYTEAPSERGTFYRLQQRYMKGYGFHQLKCMKGQGILSSWSRKRLKRNNRRILWL